jgi:hypothetical protein
LTAIGEWLRDRRSARVILAAMLFPLPFTNLLSGAVLAHSTFALGWRVALADAALAAAALGLLAIVSGGSVWVGLLAAAVFWSAVAGSAALLDRYGSFTMGLQILVLAGLAAVAALQAALPDSKAYWEPVLAQVAKAAGGGSGADATGVLELLAPVLRVMNGVLACRCRVCRSVSTWRQRYVMRPWGACWVGQR